MVTVGAGVAVCAGTDEAAGCWPDPDVAVTVLQAARPSRIPAARAIMTNFIAPPLSRLAVARARATYT